MKRFLASAALLAAIAAAILFLSRLPLPVNGGVEPILTVSFRFASSGGEVCRKTTEEERAKMLPHMRQEEICERERGLTRLRIQIDGEKKLDKIFSPLGLRSDGLTSAFESFPLNPGGHRVEIVIGKEKAEERDDAEDSHYFSQDLSFEKGRRYVIEFRKETGFRIF